MRSRTYWAVVPAAGVGKRLRADRPKQYLQLGTRTIIEHTLSCLLEVKSIEAVAVSISKDDAYWPTIARAFKPSILLAEGGAERCHSVLNGLEVLLDKGASCDDFVLVHDAVRPCVRVADIEKLIAEVGNDTDGGLLAIRLSDTLKRASKDNQVEETVSRAGLWRALTPQLFGLGSLRDQLRRAISNDELVTDEAQAMEQGGFRPKLVEGHPDNIKVTTHEDLAIASLHLAHQDRL